MKISYIEEYLELYRCLNFNEAASKLHISQSTLSKHMRALEEDLGSDLFVRDKYHVEVSSAGSEFYGYAMQVVKAYNSAKDLFANENAVHNRILIGGLVDSRKELRWLHKAIADTKKTHSNFNAMLVPAGLATPLTQLINREIDALVLSYFDEMQVRELENLRIEPLTTVPIMIGVSINSPLAKQGTVHAQDMQGKRFVQMVGPRMQSGWREMSKILKKMKVSFKTRQVPIMSMYDYAGITLESDECLLLPSCEVFYSGDLDSDVVLLPVDDPAATMELYIAYYDNGVPSYFDDFIENLRKTPL